MKNYKLIYLREKNIPIEKNTHHQYPNISRMYKRLHPNSPFEYGLILVARTFYSKLRENYILQRKMGKYYYPSSRKSCTKVTQIPTK